MLSGHFCGGSLPFSHRAGKPCRCPGSRIKRALTPWLLLRLGDENDAAGFELSIGCRHVITSERTVKKRSDPIFMPLRGKEYHSCRKLTIRSSIQRCLL